MDVRTTSVKETKVLFSKAEEKFREYGKRTEKKKREKKTRLLLSGITRC